MNLEDMEQEPLVLKPEGIKIKKPHSKGYKILIACGIIGLIAWIFGVCWCFRYMSKNYKPTDRAEMETAKEEQRKEEVLAYLEERYGEEFEIASYRGMSYAYDYVKMYAYPKGYSDEAHRFQIQGRLNEDGKMEYADSYVMVKLTDDYEAYIDPIIGEYFEEYKFYVRFNSEWLTNNLPPDTQLEDLWELHANEDYPLPTIYLYVYNADKDKNHLENMVKEFSVKNIRCSGRTVYYYDYERYTTLTESWNDNVTTSDFDNILTYLIYDNNNYKFYQQRK